MDPDDDTADYPTIRQDSTTRRSTQPRPPASPLLAAAASAALEPHVPPPPLDEESRKRAVLLLWSLNAWNKKETSHNELVQTGSSKRSRRQRAAASQVRVKPTVHKVFSDAGIAW